MEYDIKANGFSLLNARLCAAWSKEAYTPFSNGNCFSPKTGAMARVFDAGNVIVVGFKGSSSAIDFAQDSKFEKRNGIHLGFDEDYSSIEDQVILQTDRIMAVKGYKPIVVVGHSLGGGLGTLHFYRHPIGILALYTFGCPRVFDRRRADIYDCINRSRTYRVVHGNDLVARLPWLGYTHVGNHIMVWSWNDGVVYLNPPLEETIISDVRGLYKAITTHDKLRWEPKEVLIQDHFIEGYEQSLARADQIKGNGLVL